MLKVVIIDDETLVRVGLKSMIDWHAEGYDICGEAPNGKSGLNLILDVQPDIVITDIKMPLMDGLEMISILSKDARLITKPQYIILSSYHEFEYAKVALKLQVRDYMIKMELDHDSLLASLQVASEKSAKQERRDDVTLYEKYVKEKQYDLIEAFFRKLILNEINKETIRKESNMLNINIDDNVCMIYLELANNENFNYAFEELNQLLFSILNVANEISNSYFKAYTLKWSADSVIMICMLPKKINDTEINPEKTKKTMNTLCKRLKEMLFNYFNIDIFLYVSACHESILSLPDAIKQCLLCSNCKKSICESIIFYELAIKNELNITIITRAKNYISEHYKEKINLNEVANYLQISATYLSALFKKHTGKGFNSFVTEVKIKEAQRLIRENRYKLYEVSEMLGFENSFYFSKVFKKVTGMAPREYMNSCLSE